MGIVSITDFFGIFDLCILSLILILGIVHIIRFLKNWISDFYRRSQLTHTIEVKWPILSYIEVGINSRHYNGLISEYPQWVWTADPDDHYRSWLETNVGRQYYDWDWEVEFDKIKITFRKGKEPWATQAALMWN